MLKLIDPLTGTPFPSHIPRHVFPATTDEKIKKVLYEWQERLVQRLKSQQGLDQTAQPGPNPSIQPDVQPTQEGFAMHARLEEIRHQTMAIINDIGSGPPRYY